MTNRYTKKIIALILGFSLMFSIVACNQRVMAPSTSDARKAAEREYDTGFELKNKDIADDESRAEWVFLSDDGTLEVTVTWSAKNPDKLVFDERKLKDPDPSGSHEKDVEAVNSEIDEVLNEPTVTTTEQEVEPYYDYDGQTMTIGSGSEVINLWSFTTEVPNMVYKYVSLNPGFGERYTVKCTIIPTDGGAYQQSLDSALVYGGSSAPDIYTAEASFVIKYTQGDMAQFAATYESLGIDVYTKASEAEIAPYTIDMGSRNGDIVALSYQATGGVMIYRSSIAKAVFGTDDPSAIENIIGAGSGSWDDFLDAADTLYDNGYAIVSGASDLWNVCDKAASSPWISNSRISIAPEREEFLDLAKELKDEGYSNDSSSWTEAWYSDMSGSGSRQVFCFFGPAWLINYVMIGNCGGTQRGEGTYGDWRVCAPPVGFYWGGTWVLANDDTKHADGVAEILEWITLDTSDTGLQYLWANDLMGNGALDTVPSNVVMAKSDGTLPFCGNQNIFPAFIEGNAIARGYAATQYDETISWYFTDAAYQYADGYLDKDSAIQAFKTKVSDNLSF